MTDAPEAGAQDIGGARDDAPKPASWLDEFWSVALAVPMLGAFMPGLQDVVSKGFRILADDAPGWYLGALGMAMAWGFGRRALPGLLGATGRR